MMEKLRKVGDDLYPCRTSQIYRRIKEFTAINISLENTWVPKKSAHNPRR